MRHMDDFRPARRRSNWGSFVVPALLGIGVTAGIGALAFNDAPRLLQVPAQKTTLQAAPPQPRAPHIQPRPLDERPRNMAPAAQPFPRVEPPREAIQQTVFTDRNYTPKAAANVVRSERAYVASEQPKKEVGIVSGIREAPRISDRCSFWKKGSVERRNCTMAVELNSR